MLPHGTCLPFEWQSSFADLLAWCCSVRDAFLQQQPEVDHVEVLKSVAQCAEALVASATAKLLR